MNWVFAYYTDINLLLFRTPGLDPKSVTPSSRPSRPMTAPDYTANMTSSQPMSEKFNNKLSQLEKLQYQLTKQVGDRVLYS